MTPNTVTIEALAARIEDGSTLAVAPDYSGCAMSVVRQLMGRPARALHLIAVPTIGFQGDMLIGAGCVATLEAAALTLGEHGLAPRFRTAVKTGAIRMLDSTCPAIHAGLQAAEKGLPFIPLRGIIGSDLLRYRDDWTVIDNPFEPGDRIVALPAIAPDIALFHAAMADRHGNVWIGVRRELMLMAHAARTTLVSVEQIVDFDLLADDRYAAGTIPSLYVSAVAVAERGAWPLGLRGCYEADEAHLAGYVEAARTEEGFESYLDEVLDRTAATAG